VKNDSRLCPFTERGQSLRPDAPDAQVPITRREIAVYVASGLRKIGAPEEIVSRTVLEIMTEPAASLRARLADGERRLAAEQARGARDRSEALRRLTSRAEGRFRASPGLVALARSTARQSAGRAPHRVGRPAPSRTPASSSGGTSDGDGPGGDGEPPPRRQLSQRAGRAAVELRATDDVERPRGATNPAGRSREETKWNNTLRVWTADVRRRGKAS
jgi:hypothetical protein